MNLATYTGEWFALYIEQTGLAPKTVQMYRRCIDLIRQHLGSVELDQLTALDCQRAIVTIQREHPRTAQLVRVTLCRAMRVARKTGLATLILDDDTLPPVRHHAAKTGILTADQARAYLAEAAAAPHGVLLLLCLCGLRRGQALGVMRSDITGNVLHIQRQRQRTAAGYESRPLKTIHADRLLQLPPVVMELVGNCSALPWLDDCTPEDLTRAHHAVCDRIGVTGVTLHGLRHTFATLAASANVSMKLLQCALGHSGIGITSDLYADHLTGVCSVLPGVVFTSLSS